MESALREDHSGEIEVPVELQIEEDLVAVNGVAARAPILEQNGQLPGDEVVDTPGTSVVDTSRQPIQKTAARSVRSGSPRTGRGEGDDSVPLYLQRIGAYPLLSKEDEVRLGQLMEKGLEAGHELAALSSKRPSAHRRRLEAAMEEGEKARKTFAQSNLRLVVNIAKRFQASQLPLADLIQEGNLGLLDAVERFDYKKGFKFSTYATWWITQAIQRGIADTGRTIRLPRKKASEVRRVRDANDELYAELQREPTDEEIADRAAVKPGNVKGARMNGRTIASTNKVVYRDQETELGDLVDDATSLDGYEQAEMRADIEKFLDLLDERERAILMLRSGLYDGVVWTLKEVGDQFGVTREAIRQVEVKAKDKVRQSRIAEAYKYRKE